MAALVFVLMMPVCVGVLVAMRPRLVGMLVAVMTMGAPLVAMLVLMLVLAVAAHPVSPPLTLLI